MIFKINFQVSMIYKANYYYPKKGVQLQHNVIQICVILQCSRLINNNNKDPATSMSMGNHPLKIYKALMTPTRRDHHITLDNPTIWTRSHMI